MHSPEFDFLKKKYELQKSPEVEKAAERTETRTGEELPNDPATRIANYLSRFHEITDREDEESRTRGMDALKEVLHKKFVITAEEIPDSYFELQKRIAREQGHGDLEITPGVRKGMEEIVVKDQTQSLDRWIDYLASDDAGYPDWLKYFAFRAVTKMGELDKEKKEFKKRSRGTTGLFPDLNREALAYVLDAVEQRYGKGKKIEDNPDLEKLLNDANFAKLYAFAIEKVTPASPEEKESVKGEWRIFPEGSDPTILTSSLQGHGTGWCVAGESMAENYLNSGDFYVYYSEDAKGAYTIPRIGIHVDEGGVNEVRGIEADQNLEGAVVDIMEEKVRTLPGGEEYKQRAADMKRLTAVDVRAKKGEPLTKEDLRFLYEIDREIEGFGYEMDPRIEELRSGRDQREDIAKIFGVPAEQVSLTEKEALSGTIAFHYGDLHLDEITSTRSLKLPRVVSGDINLSNLAFPEGLALPRAVGGALDLSHLTSAEGLMLPEEIGGVLRLDSLTSAKGLVFPKIMKGGLYLGGLTSVDGLVLPQEVDKYLDLGGLTSVDDLILPQTIDGGISLRSITSAKGLTLPKIINGYIDLSHLVSAEGLVLPETAGSDLRLDKLTSAEGLTLPKTVKGNLNLEGLTSAEGIIFPEKIRHSLQLTNLTSAKDLTLPHEVWGKLDLSHLTSAENCIFPETVGSDLYLSSLTTAKDLTLPKTVGGIFNLANLSSAENLRFPEKVGGGLRLDNLISAKNLVLPQEIDGFLNLKNLSHLKDVVFPKTVSGYLDLKSLTSAKGLVLPQEVGGYLDLNGITSAEGLTLPRTVGDDLALDNLTSAKGLILPETVKGSLSLYGLSTGEKKKLFKQYPQYAGESREGFEDELEDEFENEDE